jgi:hypothetical protein
VEDVAERLACPQLAARGFFQEVDLDGVPACEYLR